MGDDLADVLADVERSKRHRGIATSTAPLLPLRHAFSYWTTPGASAPAVSAPRGISCASTASLVGWHPHLHEPSGRGHGARWRDGAAAGKDVVGGGAAPQVGIDPDRVAPVLDLAAVGIVNSAWRNSPVEDWHASDRPLGDGDMLRINAHTTWRVRQIIRRWRAEVGLTPESHVTVLDTVEADAVDGLAGRVSRWLVTPTRRLPTGMTLAELAGDDLDEFSTHVEGALGGFAATVEIRDARYAV